MITELLEVWLKRDRTLDRYVGAYLVCDLFPSLLILIGMPNSDVDQVSIFPLR
jgi:hypothetical protein